MSGILGVFNPRSVDSLEPMLDRLRHRGAIKVTLQNAANFALAAVADREQDYFVDGTNAGVIDGRVFNLQSRAKEKGLKGTNQAELLLRLYQQEGRAGIKELDGEYAFALCTGKDIILGRDRLGVKPMYCENATGRMLFASELKAFPADARNVTWVSPGSARILGSGRDFNLSHATRPEPLLTEVKAVVPRLRVLLRQAIAKRLDPGEPTGIFLSGGIDSAVIAAVARTLSKNLVLFSVGMRSSSDLRSARYLARHWKMKHHVLTCDANDILAVIPETVYALESYDAPLVRSSAANLLVARLAHRYGIRRVLIGEGGDELFAGYDQLKTLSGTALHRKLWNMLNSLHNGGLQRCDRMPESQGVEATVPFLDLDLLRFAFNIAPELKIRDGVEKWVLRKAFEDELPEEITWRPKLRFSAGAGSMELVKERLEPFYSPVALRQAQQEFPGARIRTAEELYYFDLFRRFFPNPGFPKLLGRTEVF